MKYSAKNVLRILYPPRCPGCERIITGKDRTYRFCSDCRKRIRPAADMPGNIAAVYVYEGLMRRSLYRFKYKNRRGYAECYARDAVKLFRHWIEETVRPDAILPVPLYPGKKRLRGYNQAEEFGRALSRETGVPLLTTYLLRIRETRPQKGLQGTERANNVKNAFKICQNGLQLERILVVDDILTTGSTLREIEKVLREAGIMAVYSLCISTGRGDVGAEKPE